jgi:hypothetical protein
MQVDGLPAPAWLTGGIYQIPNRRVVRRVAPRLLAASDLRSPGDRAPLSQPSRQSTNWHTRLEWIRSSSGGKT